MKKSNRSGSRFIKLAIALCIILILFLGYILFFPSKDHGRSTFSGTKEITVAGGTVQASDPSLRILHFEEKNPYHLHLSWLPASVKEKDASEIKEEDMGFITILVLFDSKDEVVYATSSAIINVTTTLELDPGDYQLKGYFITSEEEYVALAKEYLCSANAAPSWARNHNFSALSKDGTWNMRISMETMPESAASRATATGLTLGILVGLCIVFVLIAMANKSHRLESPMYDERQELERGRGFRYAFFTFLIYYSLMICLDFTSLVSSADTPFLYACGLFVAITVYVIYCIWHESYFAMNERPKTLMVLFAVIGILNVIISAMHVVDGSLLRGGHFTYTSMNLLCAMMFFTLFIAMFIKKLASSKTATSDDEDDEE